MCIQALNEQLFHFCTKNGSGSQMPCPAFVWMVKKISAIRLEITQEQKHLVSILFISMLHNSPPCIPSKQSQAGKEELVMSYVD